jgi:uncharacterized protein (TIGR02302 family)
MNEMARIPPEARSRLAWPLRLTFLGMFAERAARAFWPLWSIIFASFAALMLGLHELAPLEVVWTAGAVAIMGALLALAHGVARFRWPRQHEVVARLDATLPGRPISALADELAVGRGDAASAELWRAHLARMAARVAEARAVRPRLGLAARDPYALRYAALVALAVAVLFGSVWRVGTVTEMTPGGSAEALAAGPSWEGWVEPPAYTAKPTLYLNDLPAGRLEVPQGSRITLRLYGEVGALTLSETVSARTGEVPPASAPEQSFTVVQSGRLAIEGPGGRSWEVTMIADAPPSVRLDGPAERGATGEMRLPFVASDDHGVVSGRAEITLALDRVDRRYGLAAEPEPRAPLVFDLPMTITGDRRDFREVLIENVSGHPWVGLPVEVRLTVVDAAGQEGSSAPEIIELPGRRFFDTLAKAIVEQRRDLLWSRANAPRVAQVLRAISHRPEDIFDSETAYLKLRVAIRRLELGLKDGPLDDALRDEIAEALWDIALMIEDGTLAGALERLREAQERLAEAMRNGANREEIERLMQELREAMSDYIRQLAEEQQREGGQEQQAERQQQGQEITGQQLEEMLQRLQELMEQGRMDEAQQLLEALRQMMENLQVTQGPNGQQSPGQQALNGLADTLRQQQELSDDTFSDLQRQFQDGQQPGQQGMEGQEGQEGQPPGAGRQGSETPGEGLGQMLADRQRALRELLEGQSRGLPAPGTPEGDAAREALDRAGRAMEGAEEALRENDLAGALDEQAEAMEALREGMRNLGEALAQEQMQNGQQGENFGRADAPRRRDPLGRDIGRDGQIGTEEKLLQGEDVYRRARDLLDEIRRRSGERDRPLIELDYLRRLLERF